MSFQRFVPSCEKTGPVTVPGTFTGAVFAVASPLQAGLFQLIALAGILLSGAICAVVVTGVLGAPTISPALEAADTWGRSSSSGS
ncbi:hypothetical protein EG850_09675 [Gulosibacter macacae]|uniref:Uncharacterized protein n=1 Tax=Gulosibacter macacae TaxID=2488791 RepID=A0A3P3VU12_9MICO|nr:hypothetical protein EG850_09675 [Gulosibacter macacae]